MATGLLNVAPATETVAGVTVKGVSARGVAYLMTRFPELRMYMTGREITLTVEKIIMLAPYAVAAIIAVGCGHVPTGEEGSEAEQTAAEAKAAELPVELQIEFIAAILRVTMPGGVGPFVAKLEALGVFAQDASGAVAATNLAPQSPNSAPLDVPDMIRECVTALRNSPQGPALGTSP